MCWTASPVTAEAVAEWHSPDGGAVVGVWPAGRVWGAAVEARHALKETLAPEEEVETVHNAKGILTSMYKPSDEISSFFNLQLQQSRCKPLNRPVTLLSKMFSAFRLWLKYGIERRGTKIRIAICLTPVSHLPFLCLGLHQFSYCKKTHKRLILLVRFPALVAIFGKMFLCNL